MLTLAELGAYLGEHHSHTLLRVETLPFYNAASDGQEYRRFLAGEAGPDREGKAGWLARLATDTAAGKAWRRVRVIHDPMTDYERYSCAWGYPDNVAAGEQVRIVSLAGAPVGVDVLFALGDFFVIDGSDVVRSVYRDGVFQYAERIDPRFVEPFVTVAYTAWAHAAPFSDWWADHHDRRVAS